MSDKTYSVTLKLQRGDTDNRDQIKTTVEANSIEALEEKVEAVRERMEGWADDLGEIQPSRGWTEEQLPDDQATLGEGEA